MFFATSKSIIWYFFTSVIGKLFVYILLLIYCCLSVDLGKVITDATLIQDLEINYKFQQIVNKIKKKHIKVPQDRFLMP